MRRPDTKMREENACSSLLAEMADALHAGCVMLIRAYADESEQQPKGALAVAGYAFTKGQCGPFERQWKNVLASAQKPVSEFKASDFWRCDGEFRGWTDRERSTLYKALTKIINSYALFGVSATLDVRALLDLDSSRRGYLKGYKPFTLASALFVQRIMSHIKPTESVAYFFDDGPKNTGWGRLKDAFDYLMDRPKRAEEFGIHVEGYGRVDSKDSPQGQAADMLAWRACWEGVADLGRTTWFSDFAYHLVSTTVSLQTHDILIRESDIRAMTRGEVPEWDCCPNRLDPRRTSAQMVWPAARTQSASGIVLPSRHPGVPSSTSGDV